MEHAEDVQGESERRHRELIPDHDGANTTHDVHVKTKKHHETMASTKQASDTHTIVKKRKKEKKKEAQLADDRPANVDSAIDDDAKPHRKPTSRKRKSTADFVFDDQPDLTDNAKLKTKKRKKSIEPVDPTDDASLSDQSKKALAYVVSQYTNPQTWKFNKARQNWLIRNLWSPEAVPEKYTALVVCYLSNVQGRVKDTLIESCRKILDLPAQEMPEKADQHPTGKEQRARLLLNALSSHP